MWISTLIGKDLIRLLLTDVGESRARLHRFSSRNRAHASLQCHGFYPTVHSEGLNRGFRWGLVEFTVTCLHISPGRRWGPVGVAAAWTASFWISLVIPGILVRGQAQFQLASDRS